MTQAARRLRQDLEQAIKSGEVKVGTKLPTEADRCEQYGASRYAVRLALRELQELGLISRRKSAGTRVQTNRSPHGFTLKAATIDDLIQFGRQHQREVRSADEIVADASLAERIGCAAGTRWFRISSTRSEQVGSRRLPIAWSDAYIDPAHAGVLDAVLTFPDIMVSRLLETRHGQRIVKIRQDIRATGLPSSLANEMDSEPGTHALEIIRTYLDSNGDVLEISVTTHLADHFTYSMELQRASP